VYDANRARWTKPTDSEKVMVGEHLGTTGHQRLPALVYFNRVKELLGP
jgi:hypothetical protein